MAVDSLLTSPVDPDIDGTGKQNSIEGTMQGTSVEGDGEIDRHLERDADLHLIGIQTDVDVTGNVVSRWKLKPTLKT